MDRKVRGYTLIEILFVIVLMSILMYIFIKEILVIKNREDLKGTAETLAGNLNFVKSQSIVSSFPNGFCYKDQTKEFIFFADKNRDGNYTSSDDKIIISQKLGSNIAVSITNNNSLLCPKAIIFDRRGEIISGGSFGLTISFTTKATGNYTVKVILHRAGRVRVEL